MLYLLAFILMGNKLMCYVSLDVIFGHV